MIPAAWIDSKDLRTFLKFHECEITPQANTGYANVYNPKTGKLASIILNGAIPPYQVTLLLKQLEIPLG